MDAGSPPRPAALHPDLLLMDKPGRAVVRRTATALPGPRRVLLPRRAHHRTGRLDHDLERHRPALQVDQDRRPDHRPHLPLLLTHLRTGTLADVDQYGCVRGDGNWAASCRALDGIRFAGCEAAVGADPRALDLDARRGE